MKSKLVLRGLILAMSLAVTGTANASLETQMSQLRGDWIGASNTSAKILRIQKQSETSIKIYSCDLDFYYAHARQCQVKQLDVAWYHADLDGFYGPVRGTSCDYYLQVSEEYPNEVLKLFNPYANPYLNCSATDKIEEFKKVQNTDNDNLKKERK